MALGFFNKRKHGTVWTSSHYIIDGKELSYDTLTEIGILEDRLWKQGYSGISDYAESMGYKNCIDMLKYKGIQVTFEDK